MHQQDAMSTHPCLANLTPGLNDRQVLPAVVIEEDKGYVEARSHLRKHAGIHVCSIGYTLASHGYAGAASMHSVASAWCFLALLALAMLQVHAQPARALSSVCHRI